MVPLSVWMMRESGLTGVTPRQALSLSRACVLSYSTLNSLGCTIRPAALLLASQLQHPVYCHGG